MCSCSRAAVLNAVMLIGTSCRFSARFCAVTMTFSSTSVRSCAIVGDIATTAAANGTLAAARYLRPDARLSLRCRLRVIGLSPFVMHKSVSERQSASKLRYVRIVLQDGAERAFQRPEPRFVVHPVIDGLAIDRAAHLLGAGGAHGSLVLIEPQAARVER